MARISGGNLYSRTYDRFSLYGTRKNDDYGAVHREHMKRVIEREDRMLKKAKRLYWGWLDADGFDKFIQAMSFSVGFGIVCCFLALASHYLFGWPR